MNEHPKLAQPASILSTPEWGAVMAINGVMKRLTPGLERGDLDPVVIRAFPPVRHLKHFDNTSRLGGLGGHVVYNLTQYNSEQHAEMRRAVDNFLDIIN